MKVAFLYGNLLRGGAQRVMCVLADYLVARGDDVTLLTLDDGECGYELDSRVKVQGLETAGDSKNKFQSAARVYRTIHAFRRWAHREKPDAVLIFSTRLALMFLLAKAFSREPCRLIASERAHPGERRQSLMKILEEKSLLRLDGFIFQTERVSRLFPESLRKKGTVIHNGLFSPDIPEAVADFDCRRSREICAVGRIDVQKAYDVLLKAFAVFHEKFPEHRLNIYGSGSYEGEIRALAKELGISGSVLFHGNHPHVINEIQDMGMYVMTSRFEGMPNALIEAMACGLPCVCTDCEFGPAELIEDGVSGLLAPVDDVQAVAEAMMKIAGDREFARKLSKGAEKIRLSHSGDEICRRYRDYILSIIQKKV